MPAPESIRPYPGQTWKPQPVGSASGLAGGEAWTTASSNRSVTLLDLQARPLDASERPAQEVLPAERKSEESVSHWIARTGQAEPGT